MQVREIMTPNVDMANPDMTVKEAAEIMRRDDIGALPVGANDRLVGMLTDRDIAIRAVAEGKDPAQTKVSDVLSRGIAYCYDDQDVKEAADIMAARQVRRLPVVNRDKRLVGIVAQADIARSAGEHVTADTVEAISR